MLKAGMSRVDITPPQGLELEGYPHYPRYNTGAHDPLHAACMYLNNGTVEVAMVTLDLLYISKKYVTRARELAEARCGIKGENIMMTCSHTHSGPRAFEFMDVDNIQAGTPLHEDYLEVLANKIANAVCQAKENSFDGSFTCGTAICGSEDGVGGNRRIKGGPHDPLVSVMAVKDNNDDIRGVIVNYSLHPTFIHEWSTVCTADYPAYIKAQIEELAPKALTGFAQGCSGNQSSRYYRNGESYDEAERVGRTLGKAAFSVLENAKWDNDPEIKLTHGNMDLELRNFGTEEELVARKEVEEKRYKELYAKYGKSENRDEYYLWQNANLKLLGTEDQLDYVRLMKSGVKLDIIENNVPAEIMLVRINDMLVIGFPGELFVEYGLYLKALAGFPMVVVNAMTNGCLPGYVYTPEGLCLGGYEVDNSMIGENFGRHMVEKILDCVQKVK